DGSIDTVFRRGINPQVQTGPFVSRLPALVEQQELHFVQNGTPYSEWHLIFAPTNGTEQRFWTSQFNETNGDVISTLNYETLSLTMHTATNQQTAIQFAQTLALGQYPNSLVTMNNGSALQWSYNAAYAPSGMIKGIDSGSSVH